MPGYFVGAILWAGYFSWAILKELFWRVCFVMGHFDGVPIERA